VSNFDDLKWLALSAFFLVDVVCLRFMVMQANKQLPREQKLSYFLQGGNVAEVYRHLYPEGRAYQVLQVSVIITAVFAAALVLNYIWSLLAAR
jgi:hypothetical protein